MLLAESQTFNRTLRCPKCRAEMPPKSTLAAFPINRDLLDSLDEKAVELSVASSASSAPSSSVPSSSASSSSSPGLCPDCDQPASHHCHTCGDKCSACLQIAHSLRSTANHVVCDIKDKPEAVPWCGQHKDKKAELYCMKCEVLVCYLCPHGAHQGHTCKEISQAYKAKSSALRQQMSFVRSRMEQLRSTQNEVSHEQKLLEQEHADFVRLLDTTAEAAIDNFRRRVQQLKDEFGSRVNSKESHLDALQTRCKSEIQSFDKLDQEMKHFSEHSMISGLVSCGSLLTSLQQLLASASSVVETKYTKGRVVSGAEVVAVVERVAQWGSANASASSSSSSLVRIQGLVFESGRVHWSPQPAATQYEIQVAEANKADVGIGAGERERGLADHEESHYRTVQFAPFAAYTFPASSGGTFHVRVRAQLPSGWTPFSTPLTCSVRALNNIASAFPSSPAPFGFLSAPQSQSAPLSAFSPAPRLSAPSSSFSSPSASSSFSSGSLAAPSQLHPFVNSNSVSASNPHPSAHASPSFPSSSAASPDHGAFSASSSFANPNPFPRPFFNQAPVPNNLPNIGTRGFSYVPEAGRDSYRYQAITAHENFRNRSIEELMWEDYSGRPSSG